MGKGNGNGKTVIDIDDCVKVIKKDLEKFKGKHQDRNYLDATLITMHLKCTRWESNLIKKSAELALGW